VNWKHRLAFVVALVFIASSLGSLVLAAEPERFLDVAPGIPRHETLIVENPEGRVADAGRFNRWASGGGDSTGLQQLCLDTLWYIDPDAGIDGPWNNSLAAEHPIYNEDFTQMTVKLREGIYWSDGVKFTADDVIFTVETLMANPTMEFGAQLKLNVAKVYKTDDYTVVFELTQPNSRFHTIFTVRWSACFIMPKHIWEHVEDPIAFDFNPPVSLGPYVLKDYDPNGYWYLWERREDWERTSLGMQFGMPQPKYVLYTAPGPSDMKIMAQANHELDVIHDLSPEGVLTLLRRNPTSVTWFDGFPWAHPDPTLPSIILNNEKYPYNIRDVRWALALATDIVQVSMASYNGAATLSAIHVPPTGGYLEWYFDPMEGWLRDFYIEVDGEKFYPYDPDATLRIADIVRQQLPDQVPTDPVEIKKSLGYGWWKYAPDIAEKLLLRNGFTRDRRGRWLLPNGEPWKITIICEGHTRPTMTRAATMIAEQWNKFGIDTQTEVTDVYILNTRLNYGDYEVGIDWCIETWGGHPDLFWFLQSWHSSFYRPSGEPVVSKNLMRFKNEKLDRIIEAIQSRDFDDPECIDLGVEYLKLCVEEMPIIPLMSYNVFCVCDEYYWENFPTAKNPYTNPVSNWANTKFMFPMIRPKQPNQ